MPKIQITPGFALDLDEIQIDYIRADGPGGQNVNKVSTAARLRFDVRASRQLREHSKDRLLHLAGSRATADGTLLIVARRYRTQEQNRADALVRLAGLVRAALKRPTERKASRPTRASQTRRLRSKKRHGEIKRIRQEKPEE